MDASSSASKAELSKFARLLLVISKEEEETAMGNQHIESAALAAVDTEDPMSADGISGLLSSILDTCDYGMAELARNIAIIVRDVGLTPPSDTEHPSLAAARELRALLLVVAAENARSPTEERMKWGDE